MVGAFIQETGIIEIIDEMIPQTSNNNSAHFTHGQVVALMIINGLGYTSRPLYMTHQYFLKKDVETILGFEFNPEWFNDDVIGRTLDALFEYGLTPLFSELSFNVMKILGRKVGMFHIPLEFASLCLFRHLFLFFFGIWDLLWLVFSFFLVTFYSALNDYAAGNSRLGSNFLCC